MFVYLLVYGLFNDAVSSPDYTGELINWKGYDESGHDLIYGTLHVFACEVRKTRKNLS
jgi:hypothetical protein